MPHYTSRSTTSSAKLTEPKPEGIRLDSLDIHLLRELVQGPTMLNLNPDLRRSFRSIARTLCVDEDTVRNRLRRLEKSGFIQDWNVLVNPNLLGLHYSEVHFDILFSANKKELISRLRLVPGVFVLMNWYRGGLGIILVYDTAFSLRSSMNQIRSLSNTANLSRSDVVWPESKLVMSVTDWKIVRSLQRDPRNSYPSIADEARISRRTVERRLDKMIQAKALFAIPTLNSTALNGTVLANLEVGHSPQDTPLLRRKISLELEDYMWHMLFTESAEPNNSIWHTHFNLALPSVVKASEILDAVEGEKATKSARVELWEECFTQIHAQNRFLGDRFAALGMN